MVVESLLMYFNCCGLTFSICNHMTSIIETIVGAWCCSLYTVYVLDLCLLDAYTCLYLQWMQFYICVTNYWYLFKRVNHNYTIAFHLKINLDVPCELCCFFWYFMAFHDCKDISPAGLGILLTLCVFKCFLVVNAAVIWVWLQRSVIYSIKHSYFRHLQVPFVKP